MMNLQFISKVFPFIFFSLLATCYSYCQKETPSSSSEIECKVLFIGNSLTYSNNLPLLVEEFANSKGIQLKTKMVAYPNYSLEDHWSRRTIQNSIINTHYDYIIIQQGPSSQNDGRKMLTEYGKKIQGLYKGKSDTKLCYLMVWPPLSRNNSFDGVIDNYTRAAKVNQAVLIPVGKNWRSYTAKTNDYKYYSSDGFHPSIEGSRYMAEMIVEVLFST